MVIRTLAGDMVNWIGVRTRATLNKMDLWAFKVQTEGWGDTRRLTRAKITSRHQGQEVGESECLVYLIH